MADEAAAGAQGDPQTTTPQAGGTQQAAGLVVPDEIRAQHPDIIDLIVKSESMNDEERQYWVNILPIMTPEQIQNLREILTNERDQLAAIDKKYSKEIEQIGQEQFLRKVSDERRRKAEERSQAEQTDKSQEAESAESLLKKIEEL